jgi:alkyl sulfatase BDS1-like metallo-beta-lactamase superfamily hydrolase
MLASWTLNYNYWSGGFKFDKMPPIWCSVNDTLAETSVTWTPNKTAIFDCMRMKINSKSAAVDPLKISWNFRNCSSKFVVACMVINLIYQCEAYLMR